MGAFNYLGSTMERANMTTQPSMAQVRQQLTEYVVLPLGSKEVHTKAPLLKSVLLYGAAATGKTLLTHAAAAATGATFFNLSPRNTDSKYPGSAVKLLIHMVFKVSRTMAPAVIYIDEAEKVFVSDKKKVKEFGTKEAPGRIRKELLKECKGLSPGDRVVVVGNSNQLQLVLGPKPNGKAVKDNKAFMDFFSKFIYTPIPDYASVKSLYEGVVFKYGARLHHDFDISTLSHISAGYTPGAIQNVVRIILTPRRISRLQEKPLQVSEFIAHLAKYEPVHDEELKGLAAWTAQLPNHITEGGG